MSLIVVELLITTNKYRFKASSCLKFNFNRLDLSGLIITSLYIIIASSGCKVKPTKDINYSFPYQEFFFKGQEITNIMLFFFRKNIQYLQNKCQICIYIFFKQMLTGACYGSPDFNFNFNFEYYRKVKIQISADFCLKLTYFSFI